MHGYVFHAAGKWVPSRSVSFGLGGNDADRVSDSGNTFTSSWYLNSPEQFLECIPGHYDPSEVDGCLVVDKRAVLDRKPGLAYRAPMCKATLHDGETDRFRDIREIEDSIVLKAFADGDAQQRTLAALAAVSLVPNDEPAPLDFISPVAYAAWWRKHGAHVGVLHCEPTPHIEWATEPGLS
jgi:hypothetical protein